MKLPDIITEVPVIGIKYTYQPDFKQTTDIVCPKHNASPKFF